MERCRRGKVGRAKAGFVVCPASRTPFGYTYVSEPHKGWFVINEREAEVVRDIYSWLIDDGLSSYAIAKKLWEENILTRGDYSDVVRKKGGRGKWSPTTVRSVISNTKYKGIWYYGKTRKKRVDGTNKQMPVPQSEWIAVPVPAIVDEETWERAQIRLAQNKQRAKRNTKRQYLVSSLVFCPCGRRWRGAYKNHLKRAYYRCPSTAAEAWRRGCDNRFGIRQEVLESAVWEKVEAFFLDGENLRREVARRRSDAETEASQVQERLTATDSAITEVDRKLGVLLDQILTEGFAQSIIEERKQALMAQRVDLVAKRGRLQEQLRVVTITPEQELELTELASQVGQNMDVLEFEEKRRLLELLELRVDVISREQIKLSGVISEGLIVDLSL